MPLSSGRLQQWRQILDMTRQMQQLAEAGNWQAIVEMESDRKTRLQAFFQSPVSPEEAEEVARGIRDMLHSDQSLARQGVEARQEVMGSMKTIMSGRKAIASYGRFSD